MESDEQWTCGKGIAANSVLPARLAEWLAVRAEVFERHMKALDLTDENSRMEFDAYAQLANTSREIARDLEDHARQMAGYSDLPMGQHDLTIMTDPQGQAEAFRRLVAIERELLDLLKANLEEAEKLK